MKILKNSEQDEQGRWWYIYGDGHRARLKPRVCAHCGDEFLTYPSHKNTHCSRSCARRCTRDHESGEEQLMQPHSDASLRGAEHGLWKGGRQIVRGGYVKVYTKDRWDHDGTQRPKYTWEHRLVMEEMLGRTMDRQETVHHVNGIKDDNRPENLELWSYAQPPGQRVEDKLAWAREFLSLYNEPHCTSCTCF